MISFLKIFQWNGYYIPKVTFEVLYNKDFKSDTWRYTTGKDGTVDVSNLLRKTVYVREIDVPDHLIKSDEVKVMNFRSDKVNEVVFINRRKSDLTLAKKDTEGNYIPDVTFSIYNKNS